MEKIINVFPILFWNVIDGDGYVKELTLLK